MQLSDQVCSLELAKRLKELGITMKSIFGWVNYNFGEKREWILIKGTNDLKPMKWGADDCKLQEQKDKEIAAFTVAELGEMLLTNRNVEVKEETEANARAQMLIYLLENKLIELES